MQIIWIRMPAQRQKCKEPWITSHSHVITMIAQSAQKTEAVHQPASGKLYNEPTITVNGQKLKVVDKFTYLGSTLSRAVHIDDEVIARIAKASVAFGGLLANVWERNGIKLDTKLNVYKTAVLPTLLYAFETLTVCQRHLSCLRKLLTIKWQDKIPDTEVLKKAGMQSMHTVLKLAQLKASLNDFDIPLGLGNRLHRSDQSDEVSSIKEQLPMKKRICEAERERRERKANTNGSPAESMTLICSTCNRQLELA